MHRQRYFNHYSRAEVLIEEMEFKEDNPAVRTPVKNLKRRVLPGTLLHPDDLAPQYER